MLLSGGGGGVLCPAEPSGAELVCALVVHLFRVTFMSSAPLPCPGPPRRGELPHWWACPTPGGDKPVEAHRAGLHVTLETDALPPPAFLFPGQARPTRSRAENIPEAGVSIWSAAVPALFLGSSSQSCKPGL